MEKHPLAPNEIHVEHDPWGILRTYAVFGDWTIETRKFDTGRECSTDEDLVNAHQYREQWLQTGHEPLETP